MSANSCPKVRKEIWKYIVSQNLIFSVEYSSGQVDCSCDNPAKCFRYESHIFFAQKPQTFNTVLLSTKKVFKCSSVDLQSKYRNTSDVFLSIVRKKFTQNPKTVSEVQTFSEFAFFILEVLLVIWITIAITLLIFFGQENIFLLKLRKNEYLYVSIKKSHQHHYKAGAATQQKYFWQLSINSSQKIRKQFWNYIISQELDFFP